MTTTPFPLDLRPADGSYAVGSGSYFLPADLGPLYEYDGNLVADVFNERVDWVANAAGERTTQRQIISTGERALAMEPA